MRVPHNLPHCCKTPHKLFLPSFFLFFSLLSSFLIFFPSFFSVKCFLFFLFPFSSQNVSPSCSFHSQFSLALNVFSISPYYISNISITPTNHPPPQNPYPHLLCPDHHSPPHSTPDPPPFPFPHRPTLALTSNHPSLCQVCNQMGATQGCHKGLPCAYKALILSCLLPHHHKPMLTKLEVSLP